MMRPTARRHAQPSCAAVMRSRHAQPSCAAVMRSRHAGGRRERAVAERPNAGAPQTLELPRSHARQRSRANRLVDRDAQDWVKIRGDAPVRAVHAGTQGRRSGRGGNGIVVLKMGRNNQPSGLGAVRTSCLARPFWRICRRRDTGLCCALARAGTRCKDTGSAIHRGARRCAGVPTCACKATRGILRPHAGEDSSGNAFGVMPPSARPDLARSQKTGYDLCTGTPSPIQGFLN